MRVSLGWLYACNVCFTIQMLRFCLRTSDASSVLARTPLMIRRIVRISEDVDLFLLLIFPNNFLNFWSNTIEKHGVINFRSYNNKSYVSVVLSDSEVAFFGKRVEIQPIVHFSIVFWLKTALHNRVSMSSIFIVFHSPGVFRGDLHFFY